MMNRREFLQTISAAVAVAALPAAVAAREALHLVSGVCINCSGIRETRYRIATGVLGSTSDETFYSYDTDLVYAVAEDVKHVHRIWADGVCIYGHGRVAPFEVRLKDFHGVKLVAFDDFPLEPFGNRVPEFKFEVS